jgi:hypothetical protein
MDLAPFLENMRNNALQRARTASQLSARAGDSRLMEQALLARGEAIAYQLVLDRLSTAAMPSDI